MTKHTIIFFWLCLFLFTFGGIRPVCADDFSFLHISSDDGLTQNNVKSIVQDSRGFVWFGTKNGLNRYDGYRLVHYFVRDQKLNCGNQNVSALMSATDGTLWVGTDEGVYTYDCHNNTFNRINENAQDGIAMTNWVSNICQSPDGTIWISLGNQGIFSYRNGKLNHYCGKIPKDRLPVYVTTCTDGSVWACSWNNGLFRYNEQNDSFSHFTTDAHGESFKGILANTLSQQGGDLIISVQNGKVLRYNMRTGVLSPITLHDFSKSIVRNAMAYDDEIWVGTHDGLYILNESKQTVRHIGRSQREGTLLADDIIYCTYHDREGGTWVGTMFGGASYLTMKSQAFSCIRTDESGNTFHGVNVRAILEDPTHNIWLGMEDGGVNLYNIPTQKITNFSKGASAIPIPLTFMMMPEGLTTTYYRGGMTIRNSSGETTLLTSAQVGISTLNSIYSTLLDKNGTTWFGTDVGVFYRKKGETVPHKLTALKDSWIYDIAQDYNGNIWYATMGSGVWCREAHSGKIRHYVHDDNQPGSLSSNSVSSITIDHNGNVWFSTDRGGICRHDGKTDSFVRFSIEEGLPDDVAYKIVEDNDGYLWFGTNRGLVRLNPTRGDIRLFTTRDGLPSNQFNYKGGILASDGRIYMATINGLLVFSPHLNTQNGKVKDIFFTNMSMAGQYCWPGVKGSPLKQDIMDTQRITLPYNQTNITFDISALTYSSHLADSYEYRLLPVDENWHTTGTSPQISYANLAPGRYRLCIRLPESFDSEDYITRELVIVVSPPWWRSAIAYIIYAILLFGGATLAFLYYRRRKETEFMERQKLFSIEKEKELYKNKVDFFTQVAHEVRTPLTLINGPMEIIREMNVGDEHLKKNLSVIDQNTRRLLFLTSQLLDFQKVESANHHLTLERVNLTDLVTETVERFEPAFTIAGKTLRLETSDEVELLIDREAVTKILSNLFNNGRKYALHATTVSIITKGSGVMLRVVSDGPRIPSDKAEEIFQPFVRLEDDQRVQQQGTGIGLSLARSLAQMHGGQLFLDTTDMTGNAFVLTLPKESFAEEGSSQPVAADLQRLAEAAAPSTQPLLPDAPRLSDTQPRGRTILIVEDEDGIREFLASRLSHDFVVETASQGKEALEIIQHGYIDLVISDIMMPVMDGLELCRRIKDDTQLSHTPVVFLTAKNDTNAKIEGLKAGAEAYIEKPFTYDFLHTQIVSLLDNREKEREAFSKRPFFPMHDMKMSREDEEMMHRIIDIITENIREEDFNVERLADTMCMSRSSLLRKIKQLFNMPPLEFIRLIRLRHAAELIQEGKFRIGEIGYMVGFSNPSYFSKMFCRQFGVTPKEFERQVRKNGSKS